MRKLLILLFLFMVFSSMVFAQLGNRYFHCDTLNTSTSAADSTWDTAWEMATIYSDSVDLYLKIGAPDVGNWSDRKWIFLPQGLALSIGPTPKLKKLEYKTTGASTGVVYVLGYKKEVKF